VTLGQQLIKDGSAIRIPVEQNETDLPDEADAS
jgi:hypothetical protein